MRDSNEGPLSGIWVRKRCAINSSSREAPPHSTLHTYEHFCALSSQATRNAQRGTGSQLNISIPKVYRQALCAECSLLVHSPGTELPTVPVLQPGQSRSSSPWDAVEFCAGCSFLQITVRRERSSKTPREVRRKASRGCGGGTMMRLVLS